MTIAWDRTRRLVSSPRPRPNAAAGPKVWRHLPLCRRKGHAKRQVHVGVAGQQVDRVAKVMVHRGGIGHQPYPRLAEPAARILQQALQSGLHARWSRLP